MKFEWDEIKNKANSRTHGVRFEDACHVFSDPFGLSLYDEEHSNAEDRWILLGKSPLNGRIMVVVHTFRCSDDSETVRIVSARKANKSEEATYQRRAPQ
jgi:uncharacterized DUF497 family protein